MVKPVHLTLGKSTLSTLLNNGLVNNYLVNNYLVFFPFISFLVAVQEDTTGIERDSLAGNI